MRIKDTFRESPRSKLIHPISGKITLKKCLSAETLIFFGREECDESPYTYLFTKPKVHHFKVNPNFYHPDGKP